VRVYVCVSVCACVCMRVFIRAFVCARARVCAHLCVCVCVRVCVCVCVCVRCVYFFQTVRFTHLKTKRNLHTHHYESPLTKQQEVSGFGHNGEVYLP